MPERFLRMPVGRDVVFSLGRDWAVSVNEMNLVWEISSLPGSVPTCIPAGAGYNAIIKK